MSVIVILYLFLKLEITCLCLFLKQFKDNKFVYHFPLKLTLYFYLFINVLVPCNKK